MNLKIGDTVWLYDHNNRHYDKDRKIIPEKFYSPLEVTGETSRSWIVGPSWDQYKVPKNTKGDTLLIPSSRGSGKTLYLTAEAMQNRQWMGRNAYEVRRALERCEDAEKLKLVANMLGLDLK